MKKLLTTLFALLLVVGVLPAATFTWTATEWGTALSGQVYLLQATGAVPETSAIADYLEENGTSYTGDGFVNYGSTTITDATNIGTTTLPDAPSPNGSHDNFFTLIITDDGKFFLSSYESVTDLSDVSGEFYSVAFNTTLSGTIWTEGTLGGGEDPVDPNVPEPTALALLALGVAGVTLRRRVA